MAIIFKTLKDLQIVQYHNDYKEPSVATFDVKSKECHEDEYLDNKNELNNVI